MVLFCRLGTRRVRNDCCEERQERKYVELNQKPRLIYKKAKFFSFTPNTWKKFCLEAPNLNTVRDAIILTTKKMVKVTMYQGIIYRVLSVRMAKGWSRINIYPTVWEMLIKVMEEINNTLQNDTPCPTCADQLRFVKLFNGRLKESVLTPEQQEAVNKFNMTVQNQLGIQCDYCGLQQEWECHCHRVNCRNCSPDCFCDTCGHCMYYTKLV